MPSPELVLLRGLPGSGKSTAAKFLTRLGFRHYEADEFFVHSDGTYQFDPTRLADAHAWCFALTEDALLRGHRVVVANTFTRREELEPYVRLATQLKVPVRIVTMTGTWPSVHDVPAATLERMRARWEPLEGWYDR